MSTTEGTAYPAPGARPPQPSRLAFVDLARMVALLGMFAAHLVPRLSPDGPGGVDPWFQVVAGRSSALFALLAGVSLAIVTREVNRATLAGHRRRLLARAAVIALIGLVLGLFPSGLAVILVYYALLFCCALPVLTWGWRGLAWLALGWGLVGPVLSLLIRPVLPATTFQVPSLASLVDPWQLFTELLVTGYYPVLTWATYLFAGLAVGRLLAPPGRRVADAGVSLRLGGGLALVGAWLAGLALAISRWVTSGSGAREALLASLPQVHSWPELDRQLRTGFYGTHPDDSWWRLGVWAPHSGSIVDLMHTTGCALLVLGLAWAAVRLVPVLPWRILAGAGAMTLTLYSAHVLILGSPLGETGPLARGAAHPLLLHSALAVLTGAALAWWQRPGPLEWLVKVITAQIPLQRCPPRPHPRRNWVALTPPSATSGSPHVTPPHLPVSLAHLQDQVTGDLVGFGRTLLLGGFGTALGLWVASLLDAGSRLVDAPLLDSLQVAPAQSNPATRSVHLQFTPTVTPVTTPGQLCRWGERTHSVVAGCLPFVHLPGKVGEQQMNTLVNATVEQRDPTATIYDRSTRSTTRTEDATTRR